MRSLQNLILFCWVLSIASCRQEVSAKESPRLVVREFVIALPKDGTLFDIPRYMEPFAASLRIPTPPTIMPENFFVGRATDSSEREWVLQLRKDTYKLTGTPDTSDPEGEVRFTVTKNGRASSNFSCPFGGTESEILAFFGWEQSWIVHCRGAKVIVDGKILNDELGHEMVFDYRPLDGHAFYFAGNKHKVGLYLDGEQQDPTYDEVLHDRCCEASMMNPSGDLSFISFYARRGTVWMYVEASLETV